MYRDKKALVPQKEAHVPQKDAHVPQKEALVPQKEALCLRKGTKIKKIKVCCIQFTKFVPRSMLMCLGNWFLGFNTFQHPCGQPSKESLKNVINLPQSNKLHSSNS